MRVGEYSQRLVHDWEDSGEERARPIPGSHAGTRHTFSTGYSYHSKNQNVRVDERQHTQLNELPGRKGAAENLVFSRDVAIRLRAVHIPFGDYPPFSTRRSLPRGFLVDVRLISVVEPVSI